MMPSESPKPYRAPQAAGQDWARGHVCVWRSVCACMCAFTHTDTLTEQQDGSIQGKLELAAMLLGPCYAGQAGRVPVCPAPTRPPSLSD